MSVDLVALRRVAAVAAGTDRARLMLGAADEIERLRAEVDRLKAEIEDCPSCRGSGYRWYALRGTETCEACHGSGKK